MISRRSILFLSLAAFASVVRGDANPASSASPVAAAVRRGRAFLAGLLDPELDLLPEYRGADTYWLSHDNHLASKVLETSHPEVSGKIQAALRREKMPETDGRMELFFGEDDPARALPFRHHHLGEVRRQGRKIIRTETASDRWMDGWEAYADLLFIAAVAEAKTNPSAARARWETGVAMWDGKGFRDAASKAHGIYATYKLALALIAANRLAADAPSGTRERLLAMQQDDGGWITDYDAAGKRVGKANVETSSLAILALEATERR